MVIRLSTGSFTLLTIRTSEEIIIAYKYIGLYTRGARDSRQLRARLSLADDENLLLFSGARALAGTPAL